MLVEECVVNDVSVMTSSIFDTIEKNVDGLFAMSVDVPVCTEFVSRVDIAKFEL
jgi:hypothetical protein